MLAQSEKIAPAAGTVDCGPLLLCSGDVLNEVQLAYEIAGPDNAPAVLVCHALTGNQLTVGTEQQPGWWQGFAGPGDCVDTEKCRVITFNVLGGCNGSTGPASLNPETSRPYRTQFPAVTIRDMVHAQYQALQKLGIRHLAAVIGGSLGGMQAMEWGLLYPDMMDKLVILAATPYLTDYGIAFNHIARTAIVSDCNWRDGKYECGKPIKGFELARMIGMVTYRSPDLFSARFKRRQSQSLYDVSSYLNYQGEKLQKRFDAASYVCLLNAMDRHDIGAGRGGLEAAAGQFKCPVLFISYDKDLIFEPELIRRFAAIVPSSVYAHVETEYGHDGFLTEFEKWAPVITQFLNM